MIPSHGSFFDSFSLHILHITYLYRSCSSLAILCLLYSPSVNFTVLYPRLLNPHHLVHLIKTLPRRTIPNFSVPRPKLVLLLLPNGVVFLHVKTIQLMLQHQRHREYQPGQHIQQKVINILHMQNCYDAW